MNTNVLVPLTVMKILMGPRLFCVAIQMLLNIIPACSQPNLVNTVTLVGKSFLLLLVLIVVGAIQALVLTMSASCAIQDVLVVTIIVETTFAAAKVLFLHYDFLIQRAYKRRSLRS